MAFPPKLLHDTEVIVLDERPHWVVLARPALVLVGGIVFGVLVLVFGPSGGVGTGLNGLAALVLAGLVVYFLLKVLGWSRTYFVLTTDRIISRRGVLTKSGVEIPLERINTVFFSQRFLERMVGSGNLAIESAGERGNETFQAVRKPDLVQREIYVQMEDNENRKFDRINTGAALSPVEQLEKLQQLWSQGALTAEQYEAEKARILGS